jgi:hypothetical protein
MKVTQAILSLACMALNAEACTRVHTDLTYDILYGDVMSVQVWDNGNEVCHGSQNKAGASTNTEWCFDSTNGCQAGFSICLRDNGRSGTYTHEGEQC